MLSVFNISISHYGSDLLKLSDLTVKLVDVNRSVILQRDAANLFVAINQISSIVPDLPQLVIYIPGCIQVWQVLPKDDNLVSECDYKSYDWTCSFPQIIAMPRSVYNYAISKRYIVLIVQLLVVPLYHWNVSGCHLFH